MPKMITYLLEKIPESIWNSFTNKLNLEKGQTGKRITKGEKIIELIDDYSKDKPKRRCK